MPLPYNDEKLKAVGQSIEQWLQIIAQNLR